MTIVRQTAAALAAAALLFTGVSVAHAQGAGTKPAQADPMASAKASLKAQYGFSDAQSEKVISKVKTILASYKPRMDALQTKYGSSPSPEQMKKGQAEAMPMMLEMRKKMNAALLSVATKEQRPKIEAQLKEEQKKMAARNGKAKG